MKRYPNIISKLFYEPLVITRAKHQAICKILESRMDGVRQEVVTEVEKPEPEDLVYDENNTAIISVHGILGKHLDGMEMMSGGCDIDDVGALVDEARLDDSIKRIVFDFRSPGGTVTGLPELGRKISSITSKKTVAFTDSECCSGAYWLASQCREFYATESCDVGSVGVWMACLDISRMMENEGQNMQAISAGKFKLIGAYWKPLTTQEVEMLQFDVDKIFAAFKGAINSNRSVDTKYLEGQIYDGLDAAEYGLTDGVVDDLSQVLDMT